MGWILMQQTNDDKSHQAVELLRKTGECLFDMSEIDIN